MHFDKIKSMNLSGRSPSDPALNDNQIIVYHGSDIEVRQPKLLKVGFPKDFGYGFYVTSYKLQAERWACRKSRSSAGVVSAYALSADYISCNYRHFSEENRDWVNLISKCRAGYTPDFDIIEGPMANDTVWDYVSDYIAGRLSEEEFLVVCKYRHPTHQIAFLSDSAIQKYLTFIKSWRL